MSDNAINEVYSKFSSLEIDEKEYVADLISKQLSEIRREKHEHRIAEARMNYNKGISKSGSVIDLMKDLTDD